ncbi:MAG: magnesium-dependent phosphatase-1 [Armatimonadota bacterium]|nr:magnesium-dependent phosphatase-1 [Armatimonadota bacterium]MDR7450330.1 magnesium-dependent phosphatase-1 [Armatimonadota bacterium]MDR7467087.1 magnesium-dependent phosphatase-1 [Armatimonadota bacterium]MDR7493371.1 magnesium-dependent phosphatase-1 [Armatimonadota bacterium]MDR7499379.1 magnesium-dependent phosphatase-1 [Armatimonadota bacterium]
MAVRLVIFDCDRTLWDHADVSSLRLPYRRLDGDTVVDSRGERVRLFPGVREVLETLRRRGILVSIASWNRPEHVFPIFELLGLTPYFIRPKVEFHPRKDAMIQALLTELAADGHPLRPEEVLFVDDRPANLRRVRDALGPVRTVQAGVEITDVRAVLGYLE